MGPQEKHITCAVRVTLSLLSTKSHDSTAATSSSLRPSRRARSATLCRRALSECSGTGVKQLSAPY